MLERLRRVNTAKLNRRLEEVSIMISRRDAGRVARRAGDPGGAPRQAAPHGHSGAGQIYAAEQLHVVRIATKKLRYALELVADARMAPVRPLLGTLKRAQETLGRLHDLQIIEQHVAAVRRCRRRAAARTTAGST